MADSWKINDNGDIIASEVWNINKLTPLAKPASVDDILRVLNDEIR